MNKDLMNVVFCFDNKYSLGYLVTMVSLFENNKEERVRVFIITPGLDKTNKTKFDRLGVIYGQEIIYKTIDDNIFVGLPKSGHLSIASYYRYTIPQLCDESKALQLDGDIVVRRNLAELYSTDVSNVAMAVVEDKNSDDIVYRNRLDTKSAIFNNGVQLMNLDYWRENRIAEKCLDFLARHPETCLFMDQDANNVVLEGKIIFLPYTYNFQSMWYMDKRDFRLNKSKFKNIDDAKENPHIVHFSTWAKPWMAEVNHPMKQEFEHYASMYDFVGYKPIHIYPFMYRFLRRALLIPSEWLANKFK